MSNSRKRPLESSPTQRQQQQQEHDDTNHAILNEPNHPLHKHRKADPSLFLSLSSQRHPSAFPIIRRLRVPQTEEEFDQLFHNAYETKPDDVCGRGAPRRMPRPLPATHVMADNAILQPTTTTTQQPPSARGRNVPHQPQPQQQQHYSRLESKVRSNPFLNMPLLQDFFKAMGKEFVPRELLENDGQDDADDNIDNCVLDDIDNPRLSILTRGHHERYLRLRRDQQQHQHNELQKKEFQKLSLVVQTEQARFRQAMMDFCQRHLKRWGLGFVGPRYCAAHDFTTVVSHHVQLYRQAAWEQQSSSLLSQQLPATKSAPPLYYLHQCCQRITVQRKPTRHKNNNQQLLLDSIKCQVVHMTTTSATTDGTFHTNQRLEQALSQLLVPNHHHNNNNICVLSKPKLQDIPPVHLIRHDDKGLELCHEYHATILTTVETLATLLHLPPSPSTTFQSAAAVSFRIPLFTRERTTTTTTQQQQQPRRSTTGSRARTVVHCLEIPLPQPCSTPRECLTRGFQEGLDQHFAPSITPAAATSSSSSSQPPSSSPLFVYTLWTLPSSATTSKSPLRIIVRSTDRLLCNLSTNHQPSTTTTTTNSNPASVVPISLQASLEYFIGTTNTNDTTTPTTTTTTTTTTEPPFRPRTSWELPTSWEKACWILYQKLHQPRGGRIYVARIDPASATLVALEEKSIAHALAGDKQHVQHHRAGKEQQQHQQQQQQETLVMEPKDDPLVHWQALLHIIQSIPTVRDGEHVLCFPPFGDADQVQTTTSNVTLSVHPAMPSNSNTTTRNNKDDASTTSAAWHVPTWLEQANQVYLGEAALRQSFRNWSWDQTDRVPFTFPCP